MSMANEVSHYLAHAAQPQLLQQLRELIQIHQLEESLKWRTPCYHIGKTNVFLLGATDEGAVLSFLNGSLLDDPDQLLQSAGPNSRGVRLIRFSSPLELDSCKAKLVDLIESAVQTAKSGKRVDYSSDRDLPYPDELTDLLDADPAFAESWQKLTPGRQRGYLIHFNGAKQAATRVNRIEKYRDRIDQGKGMLDCVCGLSKRMPNCDGSHRALND